MVPLPLQSRLLIPTGGGRKGGGTDYCSPPREEITPPLTIIKNTSPIAMVPPPPYNFVPRYIQTYRLGGEGVGGGRTNVLPPRKKRILPSSTTIKNTVLLLSYPYGPPMVPLPLQFVPWYTQASGGGRTNVLPPRKKRIPPSPTITKNSSLLLQFIYPTDPQNLICLRNFLLDLD